MKKLVCEMTEEEKQRAVQVIGETVVMAEEMRSVAYMSDKLNLYPSQVNDNIDEILYRLRRYVGKWHFFKILFMK